MSLFFKSLWLVLAGIAFFLIAGLVAVWAPDKSVQELSARWAQPPSRFIDVDGVQAHLRDEGPRDDPLPLVLIHGTSDSLHTWDGWVSVLSSQRRVIRLDLPGFGLTGPNAEHDYSMARYVQFVRSALQQLGVQRCVLVGNSLGGHIAWETAYAAPQLVQQLVLVDAAGYAFVPREVPVGFQLARLPVARKLLEYVLPRGLVLASVRNVYGDPSKVTPELVDRYYDMTLRAGNRRALAYRMDGVLAGNPDHIKSLAMPTLILWGGKDQLIPLSSGERFARDIRQSRLVVFDDLGHLPHQEDPQRSVAALQQFIGWRWAN